jgi:hypothetical protein
VATDSMSVEAFSDEPATRGPLPGEKRGHMRSGGVRCALDWGASSMHMYGHDRGAHAARSVEGA